MRSLLSSVLDLIGMLCLIAAVAVAVAPFTVAGAVAVAGIGLLAASWVIDRRVPR